MRQPRGLFSLRTLAALCAGVLAGAMLVGVASALTSTSFTYAKPHTGYLSISRMAMTPQDNASAANFVDDWNGSLSSADGCFNAGVNLPSGARITAVRFTYESGVSSDFSGYLYRSGLSSAQAIATVQPLVDDGLIHTVTANVASANQLVSNKNFAYGVGVCVPGSGNTNFFAARITYTYTTAGS